MHANTALAQAVGQLRPPLEVAHIFRVHGSAYRAAHPLTKEQLKAMRDILQCRTAALGGHVDVCDNGCGFMRISYNSCRNRNCPKCQSLQSARWLEKRLERILPTNHFHVVVSFPHELNPLTLHNKEVLYRIMFKAAAQSLLELAKNREKLRAQIGITAILHTWNQDLLFHPHIHMVVTAGGLDQSQTQWIESHNKFLVPVKALSVKIRGKFVSYLKRAYEHGDLDFPGSVRHLKDRSAFGTFVGSLYRHKWVVYAKEPFAEPEHVFKYLSQYTHRIAISNPRLVSVTKDHVAFFARDNQRPGQHRTVTVSPEEFIRRFLLHVLPGGFAKIRHYGLMASTNAKTKLETARKLLLEAKPKVQKTQEISRTPQAAPPWKEVFLRVTGIDLTLCPRCGKGRLIREPLSLLDQKNRPHPTPIFLDSS